MFLRRRGTQAIFAWTGSVLFFSDKATRASPEEQAKLILSRHLSFFASDEEFFEGFVACHGGEDNSFVERIKKLYETFTEERLRLPLGGGSRWTPSLEISTCMDPLQRVTARKALQHSWFAAE
ncbi:hypothetical protein F4680DRAFT_452171 [Xylaria scruposa]|nr:hypothetical protein F4680DRAFT_452171 [Xylaria scruposa]